MAALGLASPALSRLPSAPDWWVVLTSTSEDGRGVYMVDKANIRIGKDDHRSVELYLVTEKAVLHTQIEFDCTGRRAQVTSAWKESGGVRRAVAPFDWTAVDDVPSVQLVHDFICETEPRNPRTRSLGNVEPVSAGRAFIKTGVVV
jgi:hypothetical protein